MQRPPIVILSSLLSESNLADIRHLPREARELDTKGDPGEDWASGNG